MQAHSLFADFCAICPRDSRQMRSAATFTAEFIRMAATGRQQPSSGQSHVLPPMGTETAQIA
jgi:hypothetical protein